MRAITHKTGSRLRRFGVEYFKNVLPKIIILSIITAIILNAIARIP
jgi:hypothetical protein